MQDNNSLIIIHDNLPSCLQAAKVAGEMDRQMGNKTDCALLGFVIKMKENYQHFRDNMPEEKFVKVFTFNSSRKSMSTVVPLVEKEGGGYRVHCKGASEIVLSKCTAIIGEDGTLTSLNSEERRNIVKTVVESMADDGLRTICLAYRDFPKGTNQDWDDEDAVISELTAIGIVGIEDPVRDEVSNVFFIFYGKYARTS